VWEPYINQRESQKLNKKPTPQELWILIDRVHPDFKPVWDGLDQDRLALAAYFLSHRSRNQVLAPTRPKDINWYCPFAAQRHLPSGDLPRARGKSEVPHEEPGGDIVVNRKHSLQAGALKPGDMVVT
jgi:hypothetical protein